MSRKSIWITITTLLTLAIILPCTLVGQDQPERRERDREYRERREESRRQRRQREFEERRDEGKRSPGQEHYRVVHEKAMMDLHEQEMHVLAVWTDSCFDSAIAGTLAIEAIKNEIRLPEAEKTENLEQLLAQTKTLGLRNALHLALKDLYLEQDNQDKALEHLRAILQENDQALHRGKGTGLREEPKPEPEPEAAE